MKPQENQKPYMELRGIDKSFGITRALQNVTLKIYPGEVVGLIGPNGAGKSTLMKILTGVLPPTNGTILLNDEKLLRYTIHEAKNAGVSCAYQDLSLCTNLNIYENFALFNIEHKFFAKPG